MPAFSTCYVHAPAGYLSQVSICLIRGMAAAGIRVLCNWRDSDEVGSFSATYSETAPFFEFADRAEAVDFCIVDVTRQVEDVAGLNRYLEGRKAALLNMNDGANYTNVHYAKNFITFSAHCNRFARHAGNIYPLGVGVTEEAIRAAGQLNLQNKALNFVNNFRPTFRQDIRASLELSLVENLERYFFVDRRHRFGEDYWRHLAESSAVLAYCGEYYADLRRTDFMRDVVIKAQAEYDFDVFSTPVAIFRWDSYRFWEACLFGCAPVQLNFHRYGLLLPHMPTPWVHYIPIDLASVNELPHQISALLRDDTAALTKIGHNARAWVLEHYSPNALAKYVLGVLAQNWASEASR